mgnify:CR=1 FL=1
MKNSQQMELPGIETRKGVYDDLIEAVGDEETLLYIVLTEYVVRNEVTELRARTVCVDREGERCVAVRIDKETSRHVLYDTEIKR